MVHYKISLLWAAALLFGPLAYAQEPTPRLSSPVTDVALAIPKVFLHIDRSVYAAGDTVWIASYNWLGERGQLDPYNQVVYVSLLNANEGEVLTTAHLTSQGIGSSYLVLPKTLATGNYTLEAYTRYMLNYDTSVRYRQSIQVFQSKHQTLNLLATANLQAKGANTNLSLQLTSKETPKGTPTEVDFWLKNRNGSWKKLGTRTYEPGITLELLQELDGVWEEIELKYTWTEGDELRADSTRIVGLQQDVVVEFYPASGKLIQGLETSVALKAYRKNGDLLQLSGSLVEVPTETVLATVSTSDLGLGIFTLSPQLGKTYEFRTEINGATKQFELPAIQPDGVVLSYQPTGEITRLIVHTTEGYSAKHPSGFKLQLAQEGRVTHEVEIASLTAKSAIQLDGNLVHRGVAWVALFDNSGNLLAERPIVVSNENHEKSPPALVEIVAADSPTLAGAMTVKLGLTEPGHGHSLKSASISIAEGVFSPRSSNLFTEIAPYYYYGSELSNSMAGAPLVSSSVGLTSVEQNILMLALLTSSSRKALWNTQKQPKPKGLLYPIEQNGISVFGQIHRAKKPLALAEMILLYVEGDSTSVFVYESDESGYLHITGFQPADICKYVVQPARTKAFQQTKFDFAQWATYSPKFRVASTDGNPKPTRSGTDSVQVLLSNRVTKVGDNEYELDQIEISANTVEPASRNESFRKWYPDVAVDYTLEVAEMKVAGSSIYPLLYRIPGVNIIWSGFGGSSRVLLRGIGGAVNSIPLLLLDNTVIDENILGLINPQDVDHIDVIRNPVGMASFGSRGSSGVLAIYTKRGGNQFDTAIGVGTLSSIGLQEAQHFFNRSLSHLPADQWPYRPTVYWETGITLEPGATKEITLFPNPDSNLIRIHVNGVTNEGLPVSGQLTYRVPN